MDDSSVLLRLGGEAGVEAVVGLLHQRARADPAMASLLDASPPDELRRADVGFLAWSLSGARAVQPSPAAPGVLGSPVEGVLVHLRDALWLLGVSAPLAGEVVTAVATARSGP